jgi:hypothetical protein
MNQIRSELFHILGVEVPIPTLLVKVQTQDLTTLQEKLKHPLKRSSRTTQESKVDYGFYLCLFNIEQDF